MTDLQNVLAQADDDDLAGLSNKGIVKRAYKDKENTQVSILSEGQEVALQVGDETVHIVYPLAKSTCSCPAGNICRHIVLGMIFLQEKYRSKDAESNGTSSQDTCSEAASTNSENVSSEGNVQEELLKEIQEYSVDKLRKKLGKKWNLFLEQCESGNGPQITYKVCINVELQEDNERVSLMSPLSYSTCSCHKKDLCIHMAQAILWVKHDKQMLPKESESTKLVAGKVDEASMQQVIAEMKTFLLELMETGLSRTARDRMEQFSRLAMQAHNCGMPRMENRLKDLQLVYMQYFKKVSEFRVDTLFNKLLKLYAELIKLETFIGPTNEAEKQEKTKRSIAPQDYLKVQDLLGDFKATYEPVGTLNLRGVTTEYFENRSGYSGMTVYFLEELTNQWYTYTVSRPVLDTVTSKPLNRMTAPWGIARPVLDLESYAFRLENAKCDSRNRLSSTKDSVAYEIEEDAFVPEEGADLVYQDFGQLFQKHVRQNTSWTGEKEYNPDLVFVLPMRMKKPFFDEVNQMLKMEIFDEQGRKIVVEVPYSKQNRRDNAILILENMSVKKPVCFLGIPRAEQGVLKLQYVECFRRYRRLNDSENDLKETEDLQIEESIAPQLHMGEVLQFVKGQLEDLFHCGFASADPDIIRGIERQSMRALDNGLNGLHEKLADLGNGLENRRHDLNWNQDKDEALIKNLIWIEEYLFLSIEKVQYDAGRKRYLI